MVVRQAKISLAYVSRRNYLVLGAAKNGRKYFLIDRQEGIRKQKVLRLFWSNLLSSSCEHGRL